MTLTNTEIKNLVSTLLDSRTRLLWLIGQKPANDEQKKCIEHGRDLLKEVNQRLEDFNVELPT